MVDSTRRPLETSPPPKPKGWTPPAGKQLYKHKGRGHSPEISIKREPNKVPIGEPFSWRTLEMLESPAWRALPPAAKAVIERIEIEHMHHAGTENGQLPVTYDDFVRYGVRRNSIKLGILIAETLGWIDVAEEGHAGAADTRRAARYALTWVDRHDGAPRSNRWKRFEDLRDAEKVIERARASIIGTNKRKTSRGRKRARVHKLRVVAGRDTQ